MEIAYNELRKFVAPEILFGCDAIEAVSAYIQNLGGSRVLLVSDRGLENMGWTDRLEKILTKSDVSFTTYYDTSPNPRDYEVKAGLEVYIDNACDMIVALGGGSPIDCAKGIGILVSNGGRVRDYEGADNIPVPIPPIICIPTTSGSSADVSQFAIIVDSDESYKMAIVSKSIVPDVSLLDPSLTVTMSPELTAESGLDALTHAFESYVSNAASPMTDLNASQAMRYIREYLPRAVEEPKNLEARAAMMLGSMQAGLAFSNASLGLVHAMAHALGGYLDLPHGLCNALLLEHVVQFNFPAARKRYRSAAEAFVGRELRNKPDDAVLEILLDELQGFRRTLNIPDRLTPGIVSRSKLAKLAQKTLDDPCLVTNPVEPDLEDVLELYEKII